MSTKKDKFSKKDKLYMELALDLAKSREGHTGPNPSVGCVVVKNDKILSIGQTSLNGRPHAEYNAINNCHENMEGSKMYVTLEPCCHHGKTSPCTSAIIKSKVSEVIYSINDIDRRVNGKSKKILKTKKIIVKTGLLKEKITEFYNSYFYNKKNKVGFFSKRFVAKEAFAKALGTGFRNNLNFKDIEIINDKLGKPCYVKTKKITEIVKKKFKVKKFNCFLSISDEKKYSTAFTIIQSI
ncbi:holo-ACP synthase [Candidatus Pelagibacter sp.]|nr:holo-ACP synthase [Candidatus Pelagibacter sp.]